MFYLTISDEQAFTNLHQAARALRMPHTRFSKPGHIIHKKRMLCSTHQHIDPAAFLQEHRLGLPAPRIS